MHQFSKPLKMQHSGFHRQSVNPLTEINHSRELIPKNELNLPTL